MSLDFTKALKAPMSADGWVVKLIIGGILACIPIVNIIVLGYVIQYLTDVINKKETLPEFTNIGKMFVTGLKAVVGSILLSIPLLLVMFIIALLFGEAKGMATIFFYLLEILYGFISVIMIGNFAIDQKILSIVNFSRALLLLKNNPNLISFILYLIVTNIVYGIIMVICFFTIIGIILVPFIAFAMLLSIYNLVGQFIQNAPHLEEAKSL